MAKDLYFSSYPGNGAWVTFSLLIWDQLRKSAVVLNTLIRHSTYGRENQGSERSLLDALLFLHTASSSRSHASSRST